MVSIATMSGANKWIAVSSCQELGSYYRLTDEPVSPRFSLSVQYESEVS